MLSRHLLTYLSLVFLYISSIHAYQPLSLKGLQRVSALSKPDRLSIEGEFLKPLLVPRVSGTPGNLAVRDFLALQFQNLNWTVEFDNFTDTTPLGEKQFSNVIATKNPNASQRIVLAAHFDSKYFKDFEFIGATDSAVPCALLLDLAYSLNEYLSKSPKKDTTLQIIFFDGEEAFKEWSSTDSTYGSRYPSVYDQICSRQMVGISKAYRRITMQVSFTPLPLFSSFTRHLAAKWESTYVSRPYSPQRASLLSGIEVLVVLDLLGTSNLKVPNYFATTSWLFTNLAQLERRLWSADLLMGEPDSLEEEVYFNLGPNIRGGIEDDHIPFLRRGVPILHLIPAPFPPVWHSVRVS